MARKKGSGKPKGKRAGSRMMSSVLPEQLAALSRKIHEQSMELRELRRLVKEGVLAAEMVRLRSEDSPKAGNYEEVRREALRSLVLTEGLLEKLGLRIDLRTEFADKYVLGDSTAPCEELAGTCRGACCKERFPLTPQDIVQAVVEFEVDDPYVIKMAPSGYCVHFDQESMKCRIWEHRPARCKLYRWRWEKLQCRRAQLNTSRYYFARSAQLDPA